MTTGDGLRTELNQRTPALSFVHVPITPGIPDELPRPDLAPVEVAQRLRNFLEDDSSAVVETKDAPSQRSVESRSRDVLGEFL